MYVYMYNICGERVAKGAWGLWRYAPSPFAINNGLWLNFSFILDSMLSENIIRLNISVFLLHNKYQALILTTLRIENFVPMVIYLK